MSDVIIRRPAGNRPMSAFGGKAGITQSKLLNQDCENMCVVTYQAVASPLRVP